MGRRGPLGVASATTLRRRRDAWIAAGVFDALVAKALAGYDRPDPHNAAPTRLRLDAQSTPGERYNPPAPLTTPTINVTAAANEHMSESSASSYWRTL